MKNIYKTQVLAVTLSVLIVIFMWFFPRPIEYICNTDLDCGFSPFDITEVKKYGYPLEVRKETEVPNYNIVEPDTTTESTINWLHISANLLIFYIVIYAFLRLILRKKA